jgi:predicted kinase
MPMLHLLCGKAASGKSTLAARLAAAPGTVLIAEDYWTSRLWPEELRTIADYSKYSRRLRSAMGGHVVALLGAGLSVVLDFPANTPAFRQWMREIVERSGADHTLHFLDVTNEECKARLRRRNESGQHEFTVSDEEFDQITSHFVPPMPDEGFKVVTYKGGA